MKRKRHILSCRKLNEDHDRGIALVIKIIFREVMTPYDGMNDVILCHILGKQEIWRFVRTQNHNISIL